LSAACAESLVTDLSSRSGVFVIGTSDFLTSSIIAAEAMFSDGLACLLLDELLDKLLDELPDALGDPDVPVSDFEITVEPGLAAAAVAFASIPDFLP
jgi:hypothetical protein